MYPGERKRRNVAPTKDQFRELQRLYFLLVAASDELSRRVGYHLPVTWVDRLTKFTHWDTLGRLRSKLDDLACIACRDNVAMSVFYGGEKQKAAALARLAVAAFLSDARETLPDGFMGEQP
jgi:hypothetical protein